MENTAYWYVPTISAQISIQIIMALVFTYLYFHDRKPFLILWGIGCYGWVLKLSMDLVIFFSQAMVSSLFFSTDRLPGGKLLSLLGQHKFHGEKAAPVVGNLGLGGVHREHSFPGFLQIADRPDYAGNHAGGALHLYLDRAGFSQSR